MGAFDDLIPNAEGGGTFDDLIPSKKAKPVGAAMAVGSPPIGEAPSIGPGPRTSAMPDQPSSQSWADVGSRALSNFLPSAGRAAGNIFNAFAHPLDTGESLVKLGVGALENLPQPRQTEERKNAIAARNPGMVAGRNEAKAGAAGVGDYFSNRFGGLENIKETIASDPAGAVMDVATVATPFKGGAMLDPLTQTGNALKYGAKAVDVVGSNALGRTTGAGARSIRDAGSAGRELGGPQRIFPKDAETVANADALVTNMNKGAEVDNVVGRAKGALGQVIKERGKDYRAGMVDISKDATVLDFAPIDAAVAKADQIANYKGVRLNRSAGETNQEISTIVNDWKTLNPESPLFKGVDPAELTAANFHTPEGLDALKRVVGDIRDTLDQGSPARTAADNAYNAIKGQIVEQAPAYAKVMADYERASDKIREASKTFSITEKATNDTAARKLLSATRDNVQTNNKGRANVLDMLAEHDSTLPYAIAGQAFQSPLPRGLVANGTAAYGASHVLPGLLADPVTAIGTMAAFSPRVVGNAVYYGGRLIGTVEDVANALHVTPKNLRMLEQGGYQAGRPEDIRQRATDLRNRNALAAP